VKDPLKVQIRAITGDNLRDFCSLDDYRRGTPEQVRVAIINATPRKTIADCNIGSGLLIGCLRQLIA
jgi:hypothetical protein